MMEFAIVLGLLFCLFAIRVSAVMTEVRSLERRIYGEVDQPRA